MIALNQFIKESQDSNSGTKSNKERKEELIRLLKGKNMKDYVSTLNEILKDPKAKTLLEDGFGGELGDTKLTFSSENISVTALTPTQNEIDINQSIDYGLYNPDSIAICLKDVVNIKTPLITFKDEFIIDGHHRWSQVFAFNPKAKMEVYNYSSKEINAMKMLKATQGAIASVLASDNGNNGTIPQREVKGQNIFDSKWKKSEIVSYIKNVLSGKTKNNKGESVKDGGKAFVQVFIDNNVSSVTDLDSACEYVANNLMQLKMNHTPITNAPDRAEMPQTSLASPDGDKKHSTPTSKGSALNKLKDDKFVDGAVS